MEGSSGSGENQQQNIGPLEASIDQDDSDLAEREHERTMNEFYDLVRGVENWTPEDGLIPDHYCDLIREQV